MTNPNQDAYAELAQRALEQIRRGDPSVDAVVHLYMEPPGHDPFGYTVFGTGDLLARRMIWKRAEDSRRAQASSPEEFSAEPTIVSDPGSVDRPAFEQLWEAGQRIAVPLMGLPRIYAMRDGTVLGVRRDTLFSGFHVHWTSGEAGWEKLTTWVHEMRKLLESGFEVNGA